jgi:hypothetical protein
MRPSTFPVGSPSAANDVSKARLGEVVCVGSGMGSGGGGGSGVGELLVGSGLGELLVGSAVGELLVGSGVAEVVVVVLAEASEGEALDGVVFTAARARGLTKAAAVSQRAAGSTDPG